MSLTPHELLRTAQRYVDARLSLIPVGVSGGHAKHPHYDALKKTGHRTWDERRGRWVATWTTLQGRLPTQDELHAWFITHGVRGMALVTGELSGLVALDFDRGAGVEMMRRLGIEPHVRSAGGGYHAYVRHPGWFVATVSSNSKRSLPPGVDVRGDGGLIVLPPTVTDAGRYERLPGKKALDRLAIPEAVTVDGRTYRVRELLGLEGAPEPQGKATRAAVSTSVFRTPRPRDGGEDHPRVELALLTRRAQALVTGRGRTVAATRRASGWPVS